MSPFTRSRLSAIVSPILSPECRIVSTNAFIRSAFPGYRSHASRIPFISSAENGSVGVEVVALNTEGPKASAKVKSFVKSYGFTFKILLDNDGEVFRRKFKGAAMPFTVLANAEGNIILSAVGFRPGDEVEIEKKIVENLISPPETPAEPAPDTAGQSGSEQ